VVFAKHLYGVS